MSDDDPNVPLQTGRIAVMDENGEIRYVEIATDVVSAAADLPDDPGRYFLEDAGSTIVPLEQLVQSRARPDGIGNAVKLMRSAYEGSIPRRAPISISPLSGGRFRVNDGNSTVTVATAAGWKGVPCLKAKSPAADPD